MDSFVRVWRTAGPRAALQAARWRVAERIGRVLVGGALARLEERVADAERGRRLVEARFADLVAMMVGVRDRTLAAERELATLRAEVARSDGARTAPAPRREARAHLDAADA